MIVILFICFKYIINYVATIYVDCNQEIENFPTWG